MTSDRLDALMKNGTLKSYEYIQVDSEGREGKTGKFRNTEKLVLVFPNDEKITIETFCSGCNENTTMSIE